MLLVRLKTLYFGIFLIPLNACDKYFIGEIQLNLEKKFYKPSIKIIDHQDSFFSLKLEVKHTFNFSRVTFEQIHCRISDCYNLKSYLDKKSTKKKKKTP